MLSQFYLCFYVEPFTISIQYFVCTELVMLCLHLSSIFL
uniref:Uncharacterized protein n=1 Tax=Arundo donax TaxID=35708 RepID=A0A0A9EL63_ARUDO